MSFPEAAIFAKTFSVRLRKPLPSFYSNSLETLLTVHQRTPAAAERGERLLERLTPSQPSLFNTQLELCRLTCSFRRGAFVSERGEWLAGRTGWSPAAGVAEVVAIPRQHLTHFATARVGHHQWVAK